MLSVLFCTLPPGLSFFLVKYNRPFICNLP
nr:MAG TPA: hypothetical protein [Caudoviricetes sp.]